MILPPRDAYSEVVDEKRRFTPDWYTWITELSKEVQTNTSRQSETLLNFLDFVPENLQDGMLDGTGTTDLGQYWQAFRDALATLNNPGGFIPQGTILTSISPNWAISYLKLVTGGDVHINYTGSGLDKFGFDIDGTTGVGIFFTGPTGGYVHSIDIDRIRVTATNAAGCFRTKNCVSCNFEFIGHGAKVHGLRVENTVTNVYRRPLFKFPTTALQTYGIWLGGLDGAANNTFESMNIDSNYHGVWLDNLALLNNFYGGTSESNFITNMTFAPGARFNRIFGVDFEGNPSLADINNIGGGNEFFGINAAKLVLNAAGTQSNNFFGGVVTALRNDAGSSQNYISGMIFGDPVNGYTDNGQYNTAVGLLLGGGFRRNGTWLQHSIPVVGASPFSYLNQTGNPQLVQIEAGTGGTVEAVSLLRAGGPQKLLQNATVTGLAGAFLTAPADILIVFYTGSSPVLTAFPF